MSETVLSEIKTQLTDNLEVGKVYKLLERNDFGLVFQEVDHELSWDIRHGIQIVGPVKINHDDHTAVNVKGELVSFTANEWKLLSLLSSQPGHVFALNNILVSIWGSYYLNDYNYLRSWTSRVRTKLEGTRFQLGKGWHPRKDSIIQTYLNYGYKLNPDYVGK